VQPTRAAAVLQQGVQVPRDGLMPDLRGLGGREALHIAASLGLATQLRGDGIVVDQQPEAGTAVDRGVRCVITLRRQASVNAADGTRGPTP
jgi:beta-lactam-binding protein with PASTA domain